MAVKSYGTLYNFYVDPIMNYVSGSGDLLILTPHMFYKIE